MNKDDYTFPHDSTAKFNHGLTVRDYIAIKAMQGILSNPNLVPPYMTKDIVKKAYNCADDMIKYSEEK